MTEDARYRAHEEMKAKTGMVIPVWFSPRVKDLLREEMLRITLNDCQDYLAPENICLVVQGSKRTFRIATRICRELARRWSGSPVLLAASRSLGKSYTVREGIRYLLEKNRKLRYLSVRDSDGDHFVNDLPNLVRLAAHIAREERNDRVIIIGRRVSLHHPMGFIRSELEALQNRVLLDSLQFFFSGRGEVLDLRYTFPGGEFPDFQSGYKIYSRSIAKEIFDNLEEKRLCLDPSEFWQYGSETISVVEGLLRGARVGEVVRTTYNVQPVSAFAEFDRRTFYGNVLAWILCRLEVPTRPALLMLDNHIRNLCLYAAPGGKEEILGIRGFAIRKLASYRGEKMPVLGSPSTVPFL